MSYHNPPTTPRKSATFDDYAISEIRRAAATGIYDIRGAGSKRKVPHFDDLLFLGASISRYPLEGYRERCETKTVLGSRYAKKPIELAIPITIAALRGGRLFYFGNGYGGVSVHVKWNCCGPVFSGPRENLCANLWTLFLSHDAPVQPESCQAGKHDNETMNGQ